MTIQPKYNRVIRYGVKPLLYALGFCVAMVLALIAGWFGGGALHDILH